MPARTTSTSGVSLRMRQEYAHRMCIFLRMCTGCLMLTSDTTSAVDEVKVFFSSPGSFSPVVLRTMASTPSDSGIVPSASGPSTGTAVAGTYDCWDPRIAARSGKAWRVALALHVSTRTAARPGHA